ncbi:MAG: DUF5050 domain-containing protein [Lachnospiraceae bacterium]|nr:DUF5050 domain-containing protein [Lachnospiraceae bacterium]
MTEKKKNILILSITFGVLLVLFFFMLLSGRIPMNDEYTVGNTAGNLNNRGYFCESDGKIYFANAYDNYALYSMNPDETEIEKLNSNSVSCINAGGKYLYYSMQSGTGGEGLGYMMRTYGIYRSKKNGSASTCLDRAATNTLQLCGNYLYYDNYTNDPAVLSKIKIDKSDKTDVTDYVVNPACYTNGKIYFNGMVDDHALYTLDTATDQVENVWQGDIWDPVMLDDYVYYMDIANNYRLCRYSLSGDVVEILTDDRVDYFNVYGNFIYFQTCSETEPALKRMVIDGSNPEIVAEGVYENINITSQYVYFNQFGESVPVYKTSTNGAINVSTFDAAQAAAVENMK